MIETLIKGIIETGNLYLIIILVLILIIYGIVKIILHMRKNEMVITETVEEMQIDFQSLLKNIQNSIDEVDEKISNIYFEYNSKIKDMEHEQEKMHDKIISSLNTMKEVRGELMNLKHKVELMIVQSNQYNATLNKGL